MEDKKLKLMLRVVNVDLDGNKQTLMALQKIKGVGFSFASALCNTLNLNKKQKVGYLSESQVKEIEETIRDPKEFPSWMLNRQKDYDTFKSNHLTGSDLKLRKEFDIRRLKKIKSRRGMRHQAGLPVRGQRTRAHFRKGKSLGVSKKKVGKK